MFESIGKKVLIVYLYAKSLAGVTRKLNYQDWVGEVGGVLEARRLAVSSALSLNEDESQRKHY